jgi:hypothetical protein
MSQWNNQKSRREYEISMDNVLTNAMKDTELLAERPDSQFTSTDLVGLNFKVPLQFRLQFKIHATKRNMTMTELLLQLFEGRLRADEAGIHGR